MRGPALPDVFCDVWMSVQGESGKPGNSGEVGFPGSVVSSWIFFPHHLRLKRLSKPVRDNSYSCISGLQRFPRHSWATRTEGSQGNSPPPAKTCSSIEILINAFWIAVVFSSVLLGLWTVSALLSSCSNWLSQQGHGGLIGQKGETGAVGSKV